MTEQNTPPKPPNRRKGPDWLLHSLGFLSIAGWVVFVVALGFGHMAKPEFNSALVRYWRIPIRDYWHPELTPQLLYLLWWCCGISLLSLLLNRARLRRADDRLRYNLVVLLLVSSAALLYLYQVV